MTRVDLRSGETVVAVFGSPRLVARVLGELGAFPGFVPQAPLATWPPLMAFVLVAPKLDLARAVRAATELTSRVAVIATASDSAEAADSLGVPFIVASSHVDGLLGLAAPWSLPGLVGVAPEDAGAFFAPRRFATASRWEIGSWDQPRLPESSARTPSAVLLTVFTDVAAHAPTLSRVGDWYLQAVGDLGQDVDALLSVHEVPCIAPFAIVTTARPCS